MSVVRDVPCNGCRACCQGDLIVLHPECGDVVDRYDHLMMPHPFTREMVAVLAQKPNHECVYLGPRGCTIHDRAPAICREFDCRLMFLKFTRAERWRLVRDGMMSKDVFAAGRARVKTLTTALATSAEPYAS